eukprot:TRINITY_DN17851_c0_g2_i1.p1 TRINITY_DN17851_c0_g2~~TRINITY_DN17851_c0_g2_i1.p1  ORF type:complete len:354 (-),score=47.23 TRINITY_DN17851_c0_g2_i1:576-1637(-)
MVASIVETCADGPFVAATFVTAMLAELAGAALGFGPAILYQISWQLFAVVGLSSGSLQTAVGNIVVEDAPCAVVQMIWLRKSFRPRLSTYACLPVIVTLPMGTMMLERFGQSPWMRRLVGIVLVSVLVVKSQSHRWKRQSDTDSIDLEERRATPGVVAAVGIAGFLRGLCGVAGPAIMVMLLFYTVNQRVWRCTANLIRLTMIIVQGMFIGFREHYLHWQCWPMYTALMCGGLLGLAIGNAVAPHIDAAAFHLLMMVFLGAGALLLLSSGSSYSGHCAVAVTLIAGLILLRPVLCFVAKRCHGNHLEEPEEVLEKKRALPPSCGIRTSNSGSDGDMLCATTLREHLCAEAATT